MKNDIKETKKIVKEYILKNYGYLFMKIEDKFIGCKYTEKDFFLFFVSIFNGILMLTYRENYQEKDVVRVNIEQFSAKQIEDYIDSIMSKEGNVRKNARLLANDISTIDIPNKIVNKKDVNSFLLRLKNIDKQFATINFDKNEHSLNMSVGALGISLRLYNCLVKSNINTLGDILYTPLEQFYKIKNLGRKCMKELIQIKENYILLSSTAFKGNKNLPVREELINYKLPSLNVTDEIKQICENSGINNLYDLLTSNHKELMKIKEDYIITSYDFFINVYVKEVPIKPISIEKIDINDIKNVSNEDYEKYIDFGIKIGEIINDFLVNETSPRASEIIKYRFCFISDESCTLQEIGDKYNLSRERIRQIINKYIRRISSRKNRKKYVAQIVSLINEIDSKEIIKYYILGIINIYNKVFLKFLLDIISKKYSDQVFEYLKNITYLLKLESKSEKQKDKLIQKSIELIKLIKFPKTTINYSNTFSSFSKQRNVNPTNNIGNVHLIKQDKDVDYESFSEKKILELLSYCPYISNIKVQSLKIKYEINNCEYLYYPDFQILFDDGRMAIIEVKDCFSMGDYKVINKYNVLKEYCEKYGIGYMMTDERGNDFETLKKVKYNEEDKKKLVNYLINNKKMNYITFLKYKNGLKFNNYEFLSMIISDDNMLFNRHPFYIKYGKDK